MSSGDGALDFRVYGEPVAKGSMQAAKTRDGRPYVRHDNPAALDVWHKTIESAAEMAMIGRRPYAEHEQLNVALVFLVHRPISYPRRVTIPYARPDIDKLVRAVLDALTGPVFPDDGAVSTLQTRKRFALAPSKHGVFVHIEPDRL